MKLKNLTYFAVAAFSAIALSSCNDFLDKTPDNRVDLSTPRQMKLALINGYSDGNISLMCELSSDNFEDNNAPDDQGVRYNLATYNGYKNDDQVFAWQDVNNENQQDSPTSVWEGAYHAIAVANGVLESINNYAGDTADVSAQKGEALLIRAYNHFTLVNMFAQQYRGPELSKSLQGIPYITEPETKVLVNYDRGTVEEDYEKIEKDLLEGLPLINDNAYEVPKYHFNKAAAYAFAARFYLFKRDYEKCEYYATMALGGPSGNAATYMSNVWKQTFPSYTNLVQAICSSTNPSNLMLVATSSLMARRYMSKYRYTVNRNAAKATVFGPGPTWPNFNFHPCFNGKLYISGGQEYGVYFPKDGELFEYTDKVAGIGYPHVVRAEFTGEEVLLERAEARLYLGKIDEAIADLKIWNDNRANNATTYKLVELTKTLLWNWYSKDTGGYGIVKPLHIDEVCPSDKYKLSDDILPYIQCVLHFRRIETIFDGYRWFDIKRYGIEITHKIGKDKVDKLTLWDGRRAFQVPAEAIAAGLTTTDRTTASGPDEVPIPLNVPVTNK
jgi:hypothetical protein